MGTTNETLDFDQEELAKNSDGEEPVEPESVMKEDAAPGKASTNSLQSQEENNDDERETSEVVDIVASKRTEPSSTIGTIRFFGEKSLRLTETEATTRADIQRSLIQSSKEVDPLTTKSTGSSSTLGAVRFVNVGGKHPTGTEVEGTTSSQIHSSLDGITPNEVTLVRHGGPAPEIPGAYAVGPNFPDIAPQPILRPAPSGSSPSVSAPSGPVPISPVPSVSDPSRQDMENPNLNPNAEGLAEAELIEQEDLEEAVPAEEKPNLQQVEESRETDRNRAKGLRRFGAIWVIAIVAIALSFWAAGRHGDSDTTSDTPTAELPPSTLAPVSYVLDLPDYTLQVLQMDANGTSPQAQAYQWLMGDPNLETYSLERKTQRFALAVFYFATAGANWLVQEALFDDDEDFLKNDSPPPFSHLRRNLQAHGNFDPDGPKPYKPSRPGCGPPKFGTGNNTRQRLGTPPNTSSSGGGGKAPSGGGGGCMSVLGLGSKWMEYGTSECDWYSRSLSMELESCSEDGVFEKLMMRKNGLEGSLPLELSLLSSLKKIDVASNELNGIGLRKEWMESWTGMEVIELLKNDMTGSIPTEIGLWRNLSEFRILANRFTGTVPTELYGLTKLQSYTVVDNLLTGTLSGELLPGLHSLTYLELAANKLSGTIPTEVGLLDTVENIAIHQTLLTGAIPSEMGLLTDVYFVSMGKNGFESTLPSELGLMALNITFSVMDNERLSGSIPKELGEKSILNIYLQGTGLTGTIPALWCETAKILKFDCSDTLCGCDCPCSDPIHDQS